MHKFIPLSKTETLKRVWRALPQIKRLLQDAGHVEEARYALHDYLDRLRRDAYNMKSDTFFSNLNIVEKRNVRECIRVFANTIRTENEYRTDASPLTLLYELAKNPQESLEKVSVGFLMEYLTLFQGIRGKYGQHYQHHELLKTKRGRAAAIERSSQLDHYGAMIKRYFKKYNSGLNAGLVKERKKLKKEILRHFTAKREDWFDYTWHMKHIIKDIETLSSIVHLNDEEIAGLQAAEKHGIPFEITPHYLSLFNKTGLSAQDLSIRAQVIPSLSYVTNVVNARKSGTSLDFMGEEYTSPIDGITRRYPQINILKPFNSCPQICVYCQRNWEVKHIDDTVMLSKKKMIKALDWIRHHTNLTEVLVTGGDPLTLDNAYLDWLLGELADIRHLDRIRIGTRTPVTLPMRFDDGLLKILKKYHQWGRREIAVITHFQHPTEMSQDSLDAVKKIKRLGINIYNQEVFTYYNSRKFESAYLRKILKVCGVDPYYTFNCQGKQETMDFRVPIARIEQERKEEARLLPGMIRTDEPVFNVPRLGKSHLRAWQDHEIISILPDGQRVYRFYSWENTLTTSKDYLYTDVGIYDYLKRLFEDGENITDYLSIWYYF